MAAVPREGRILGAPSRVGKVIYLNLLRFLISRLRAKDEELDLFMMGSL